MSIEKEGVITSTVRAFGLADILREGGALAFVDPADPCTVRLALPRWLLDLIAESVGEGES